MPVLLSKILPYLSIVLFVIAVFVAGDYRGAGKANTKCATAQTTAITKEIKTDEKIQQKVLAMPATAVTRELLAHWMRD